MGRDRQAETRESWFKRGILLPRRDESLASGLLGLGSRERRAIQQENSRPWGKSWWAEAAVADRGRQAKRRASNNGRRNRGSGRSPKPVVRNASRGSSPKPWWAK